jgi:hypothetical protein
MDLSPIWNRIDIDKGIDTQTVTPGGYWNYTQSWNMAQVRIPAYVCPSSNVDSYSTGLIDVMHHGPSCTLYYASWPPPAGNPIARTTYLGVNGLFASADCSVGSPYIPPGYTNTQQFEGIFRSRSKTTFGDILDGSSNTLLIGEAVGQRTGGTAEYVFGWMGPGVQGGAWVFDGFSPEPTLTEFSSDHAQIKHFALADGSVRAISNNVNTLVFQSLCGMKDGSAVTLP